MDGDHDRILIHIGSQIALGGAGISGVRMSIGQQDTNLTDVEWFYLEDVDGMEVHLVVYLVEDHHLMLVIQSLMRKNGLAGGGGGGASRNLQYNQNNSS